MKKLFFSSMFALFLFTSCENYLDVNNVDDQTNKPDFGALAPNAMLAGALNNYTSHQVGTLSTYGNRLGYVWGLNTGFTSNDPAWTYTYDSNSYPLLFENTFLFADNFQDIIDKEAQFPHYEYHFGVAKIFKVMLMDYATALYGDVPYTEAFNSNIPSPKYDDDKLIVADLFKQLDLAREYFDKGDADDDVVALSGSDDIVFKGGAAGIVQWRKFINTIELKLLLRLSKTTDASLVAIRTARFIKLNAAQNFISTDVTANPGFTNGPTASRSPLYRLYGRNEAYSDWTSANRSNAAGDFIVRVVNGVVTDPTLNSSGVIDPRRPRMFGAIPAGVVGAGTWVGNVQGNFPLTEISRFGTFFTGRTGADVASADLNGTTRDAFIMLAAESKFLQAEAIQRGYLTGDAEATFKAGITESFRFYSTPVGPLKVAVPILDAAKYITDTEGKVGLGWTGSGADKINAIITQKYLALAQWHGIELYIDQQRTGYPVLPLPLGVLQTNRPHRLIYPSSEYASNSANVPNITSEEIFSINAKTPYYLQ